MNYVLELSQEQMIGRKARAEKYALMGRGFTIQPADNGLIVQPFEDDEDDIYTEEQIMHSKVVEVDEDWMIYYEDGDRCGLHFPNGGMPIEEFQAKRNNLFANETN